MRRAEGKRGEEPQAPLRAAGVALGRKGPPVQRVPHHSLEVVAHQGPVVVDLALQDDEQEEQAQQDIAQVAEDVVEGARGGKGGVRPHGARGSRQRPPSRFLPEVAQRVCAEEVVIADVLVPRHVHHLQEAKEGLARGPGRHQGSPGAPGQAQARAKARVGAQGWSML